MMNDFTMRGGNHYLDNPSCTVETIRLLIITCMLSLPAEAQQYRLRRVTDTLYYLNEWRLPYPVYQFQTGDIDGDGSQDAVVGVIKPTRFHPEQARRVFVFKQVNGKVRPLWMGSRLGGILEDFRLSGRSLVSLETDRRRRYAVAVYAWEKFGLEFQRFIVKDTDSITARREMEREKRR